MVAIGAPRNSRPSKGELRDLLADSLARNVQACSVEKSVRSAGSPGGDAPRAAQDARRPGGEEFDHAHEGEPAGVHQFERERQRRLESGDAERRAIELDVLAGRLVRRVVGGDGVDGSVGEAFDQRRAILDGSRAADSS